MKFQQEVRSIAQIKVNFMKNEDKIAELGSKVWYRQYRDGSFGLVGELTDGLGLKVDTTEGQIDATAQLIGTTINVRFSAEQFEALNARFHEIEGVGAYIEINLDGTVATGMLTIRGEETLSLTIYTEEVVNVEPMILQRVGTTMPSNELFSQIGTMKRNIAEKSAMAIATNRSAREGMKLETAEVLPM